MPAHATVDNSYNHYLSADLTGLAVGSVFSFGSVVFGLNGMALGWYLGASLGQGMGGEQSYRRRFIQNR
ncbi:hypothetical protein FAI41_03975 [Acetobacteraceae bacterium]|nr:hypothetical protein FAI41_03975 [Acetobacteraceae bacterium]